MKRDAHRGTRRQGVGLGIDLDPVAGLQAKLLGMLVRAERVYPTEQA
jgi:hypothetical protein